MHSNATNQRYESILMLSNTTNQRYESINMIKLDILNWNSVYRCVKRIRRLSLTLGRVQLFSAELCPLDLEKIPIMCHKNTQVKFRCGSI